MNSKTLPLSQHLPNVSQLAFGCMGLGGGWNNNPITQQDEKQAREAIEVALEGGINFFDHADIYTFGKAEQVFGEVLKQSPSLKDQMYIQSKCGIRFEDQLGAKRYDFSADWVTQSVDGILSRLNIDKLDVLLLHRPDPLVEFDELSEAINRLKAAGKIEHLGVSNMNHAQMQHFQSRIDSKIIVNQIQMSLNHLDFIKQAVVLPFDAQQCSQGTLEYCDMHGVQLQAWGCLAQGIFTGRDDSTGDVRVRNTIDYVTALAAQYQVSREAIVLAFLTRLPQGIQPVIGTANPARVRACLEVDKVKLSRAEWYTLLEKSLGQEMP